MARILERLISVILISIHFFFVLLHSLIQFTFRSRLMIGGVFLLLIQLLTLSLAQSPAMTHVAEVAQSSWLQVSHQFSPCVHAIKIPFSHKKICDQMVYKIQDNLFSSFQDHTADLAHSLCSLFPPLRAFLLPRVNPIALLTLVGFATVLLVNVIVEIK